MPFLHGMSTLKPMWKHYLKIFHLYLKDDIFIIAFLPEAKHVKNNVWTCLDTYDFTIAKDWWGVNEFSLCSCIDLGEVTIRILETT